MCSKLSQHRTRRARHVVYATAAAAASAIFARHANAVTFNQYYYDVSIYSDAGLTNQVSSVVINQSNPVVNLPMGDYLSFGISDVLTNNPNPAAGDTSGVAPKNQPQPANLGLASDCCTVYSSDPNAVKLAPNLSGGIRGTFNNGRPDYYSTASVQANPTYLALQDPGDVTVGSGASGYSFQIAAQTASPTSPQSGSTTGVADLSQFTPINGDTASFANSTPLFNNLSYQAVNVGTVSLSPEAVALLYWTNNTIGRGTSQSTYNVSSFGTSDTVVPLPSLVVNIAGTPLPTHPIISLTSIAPTSNYAAQILSGYLSTPINTWNFGQSPNGLSMTQNQGSYNVAQALGLRDGDGSTVGPAVDYIQASGLVPTPQTDEIFALAVSVTGAQLQTLATDINSTNAYGFGSAIASTSLANDPFPSMYNLFLTFNSSDPALANGADYLGFDFTQDPNVTGATVTAIAVTAVPEPMTLGTITLGLVGGLLLRRRIRTT
jgi:hypothetical protein